MATEKTIFRQNKSFDSARKEVSSHNLAKTQIGSDIGWTFKQIYSAIHIVPNVNSITNTAEVYVIAAQIHCNWFVFSKKNSFFSVARKNCMFCVVASSSKVAGWNNAHLIKKHSVLDWLSLGSEYLTSIHRFLSFC